MQVIAPDFFAPFTSSSSAQAEERPGEGLFDSLLREEEARYRTEPPPRRDLQEAAQPSRDDSSQDVPLRGDRQEDEPLREVHPDEQQRPVGEHDPQREPDSSAADDHRFDGEDNRSATAASGTTVAETGHSKDPDTTARPTTRTLFRDELTSSEDAGQAAAMPAGAPAGPHAGAASTAAAAVSAAPTGGEASVAKATAAVGSGTTAAAQPLNGTASAAAETTDLPASAAAPASQAVEKASATATAKQPNQVAAEHRQSPTQAPVPAGGERTTPTAGNAAGDESFITVETAENLSSRPTATLGGGAATAALAQTNKPATAGRTTGEAVTGEAAQPASAQKTAAQPGQQARVPEVALAAAADRAAQVSPALAGGGSGDTGGSLAGQSHSLAAPLAGTGAAGTGPTQNTSFAEAMANARNTPSADPAEQIAVQVRRAQVAGQEQLNIKLHPAELGRIEVRLESSSDGTLRAVISAERSETLDLLQRDARGLERALQDAGVKTDSGSLNFNLRGQGQHQGQQADRNGGAGGGSADRDAAEAGDFEATAVPAEAYRPSHDGALDIRV